MPVDNGLCVFVVFPRAARHAFIGFALTFLGKCLFDYLNLLCGIAGDVDVRDFQIERGNELDPSDL
jgi:hypothetical protein